MWVRKDENRFRRRVLMHLPTWALRFIARYYGRDARAASTSLRVFWMMRCV